jgi:hypothetical protein
MQKLGLGTKTLGGDLRGLTYAATAGGVVNPSFLALDPRGGHLWEAIW